MLAFFKRHFRKWLMAERSPKKLTFAFCWGTFIALAPIPGFHTPLLFLVSWLLGLNAVIVFAVVYLINNPWTMLPIYALDYLIGYWLVFSLAGIDLTPYNPSWMEWFNNKVGVYLGRYLGIKKLCLWYFLFGGFLLALLTSLSIYPFVKRLFIRLSRELQDTP
jgi:uncharacterized protein (DUF2062 family)